MAEHARCSPSTATMSLTTSRMGVGGTLRSEARPRLGRVFRPLFIGLSVLALVAWIWLVSGWPTGFESWLDVTSRPRVSVAIVVLAAGSTGTNLPLPSGWERLDTAAQLYSDGFAPFIIFSGGGTERVSEAEIYANAAAWLGVPRQAMLVEPSAQRTSDHGPALLGFSLPEGRRIGGDTPLLVVTSAFHSRRALMSFGRVGFTQVRVVSRYTAKAPAAGTPASLVSKVPAYAPSSRQYDDMLFRLAHRSFDVFISLREVGAIVVESRSSKSTALASNRR